jgi:hypothetical protein
MGKTKRHHYVPRFLIKQFLNKNGKIAVYDKKRDTFFVTIPDNIFLEGNRNTYEDINNERKDTIERMYADLDSVFSVALNNVITTGRLETKDLRILLFAYTQKWRVPEYEQALEDAIKYYSVDDLGLGIKKDGKRINIELESFFNSIELQESKRFLLSIQPFRYKDDYKKIFKNCFLLSSPYPALIGDCPFMEVQADTNIIFEDFIFPIHEQLTLVFAQRIDKYDFIKFLETKRYKTFIRNFSLARDATTIYYADRFIGCPDEEYLKTIVNNYKTAYSNEKMKSLIPMSTFNFLNNYNNDQYYK